MSLPDAREPGGSEICGAIYNHGCVLGDSCALPREHAGDHGSRTMVGLIAMMRDAEEAGLYDQPEAVAANMPGGSGAGSTVEEWERLDGTRVVIVPKHDYDQLRADLEAAQRERDQLMDEVDTLGTKVVSQQRIINKLARELEPRHSDLCTCDHVFVQHDYLSVNWNCRQCGCSSFESQSRAREAELRAERDAWKQAHDDLYNRLTHMQAERDSFADLRDELQRKYEQDRKYYEWCGECGEARADIPRCTVCVVEYAAHASAALDATEQPARELPERGPGYDPLCQCGMGEPHRLRLHDAVVEQPARAEDE